MASNETVEELVLEMCEYPKSWGEYNHLDWKALAKRILSARNREIAELRDKLKVADDALRKLQERLVAGVYDGTIDPHEALKIAEDALAAIREKGENDDK